MCSINSRIMRGWVLKPLARPTAQMGRCLDGWFFLGATWMCWKRVCWDSVDLFTVYKIVYVSIYLSIYRIYLLYLIYLSIFLSFYLIFLPYLSTVSIYRIWFIYLIYLWRLQFMPGHLQVNATFTKGGQWFHRGTWTPWLFGRLAAGSSDPFSTSQGSNCSTSTWARLQYHVDSRG